MKNFAGGDKDVNALFIGTKGSGHGHFVGISTSFDQNFCKMKLVVFNHI